MKRYVSESFVRWVGQNERGGESLSKVKILAISPKAKGEKLDEDTRKVKTRVERNRLQGEGIAPAGYPSPERDSYSVGIDA